MTEAKRPADDIPRLTRQEHGQIERRAELRRLTSVPMIGGPVECVTRSALKGNCVIEVFVKPGAVQWMGLLV